MFSNPEGTPEPVGLSRRAGGSSLFAVGMRRASSAVPETTTTAGRDGHFEFTAVRSGDWRIDVPSDSVRARGTTEVHVGRSDVDDLEIHVATPFKLTGTIEWKGQDLSQRVPGCSILMDPDRNEFVGSGYRRVQRAVV